ncbi:MAG TPA: protein adenylyltransferase SelO family protein, partial [Sphingomicrobium sp.]|nr:protein adenylyltransferase SelO family protein [Sphingomicrobium sp.]
TGESFDYGPWRFAPEWEEEFVAAYFDHGGLYAFGRQPEAIHWDVAQLAGALSLIGARDALGPALDRWPALFERALVAALRNRLGVEAVGADEDLRLVGALLAALRTRSTTIDRLFFDWRGGRVPDGEAYAPAEFATLATHLEGRSPLPGALDHPYWSDAGPCSMHIDEVEAIWARIADHDDWAPFEAKVAAIRRMGQAMTDGAMTPPCADAGKASKEPPSGRPEDQ